MRIRHFVVLVAVMCVMTFGALNGDAQSSIRVRHVPKSKLGMEMKAVGSFQYNVKLNRWESADGKKPVVIKPVLIGPKKIPAYLEAGNMMADPCDRSYIIITDKSYAIIISTNCGGDSFERLHRYAKSYSLPKGVHAIRAKEEVGWEVIE